MLDETQVRLNTSEEQHFLNTARSVIRQGLSCCRIWGSFFPKIGSNNEGLQTVHGIVEIYPPELIPGNGSVLRVTNNCVRLEEDERGLSTVSLGDLDGGLLIDGLKPDGTRFSYQLPRAFDRLTRSFISRSGLTLQQITELEGFFSGFRRENCISVQEYLDRTLAYPVNLGKVVSR